MDFVDDLTTRTQRLYSLSMHARFAALVIVLLSLAGCSTPEESTPDSDASTPDFSESVDIGGRDVFLTCEGDVADGAPTVVLISGYHDSSDVWIRDDVLSLHAPAVGPPVFPALAESHRVCAYDRPGTIRYIDDGPLTDRSTPVPQPRTVADIVVELSETLSAAGISGPLLLVGHSLGGLIARAYAQTYPAQVAGVVFVDALSPTFRELLGDDWAVYRDKGLNPPVSELPIVSMRGPDSERVDIDTSITEVVDGPAFPDVPVVVLTKTEPFVGLADLPGLPSDVVNTAYQEAQQDFVDLRPSTPQIVATGSDHYIQLSQPDLVVSAVEIVAQRIPR